MMKDPSLQRHRLRQTWRRPQRTKVEMKETWLSSRSMRGTGAWQYSRRVHAKKKSCRLQLFFFACTRREYCQAPVPRIERLDSHVFGLARGITGVHANLPTLNHILTLASSSTSSSASAIVLLVNSCLNRNSTHTLHHTTAGSNIHLTHCACTGNVRDTGAEQCK